MRKTVISLFFIGFIVQLHAQAVKFPLNMTSEAFKDSLVELFNFPFPKSSDGFDSQLEKRFPWVLAIMNHPRYHVQLSTSDKNKPLAGHIYIESMDIRGVNFKNGKPIGDFASVGLPFGDMNTSSLYTRLNFEGKRFSSFESVYVDIDYYGPRTHYLPDGYREIGLIFYPLYVDPADYKSVKKPNGEKFDKKGSSVLEGYRITRILKSEFGKDKDDLRYREEDWERVDSILNKHFAKYFYNQHLAHFEKHNVDRDILENIIANKYIKKGDKKPDINAAIDEYNIRQKADDRYEERNSKYKLAGPYGFDECNQAFITSAAFPCKSGDCEFGEGTVDMGKLIYTGKFVNGIATKGILLEKNSQRKIEVELGPTSGRLIEGKYITDSDQEASFKIINDTIYFNVKSPEWTYVGTTKALSADGGVLNGIYTKMREEYVEIFYFENGVINSNVGTIRERSKGEYQWTGEYIVKDGYMTPNGNGVLSFPAFTLRTVPLRVQESKLFEAISQSQEAIKVLNSLFSSSSVAFKTPILKKWMQDYKERKIAERRAFAKTLSDEDLLKWAHKENVGLDGDDAYYGEFIDILKMKNISRTGHPKFILVSKKDGSSKVCIIAIQPKYKANYKTDEKTGKKVTGYDMYNEADSSCGYFNARGDVQEIYLDVETKTPYTLRVSGDNFGYQDFFLIFINK